MGHLGIDRPRVTAFLRRIEARFGLEAAYLAGSRARGDEIRESDYDIVLVSDGFARLSWIERLEVVEAEWDVAAGLHVFPYTAAELAMRRSEIGSIADAMSGARPLWPPPTARSGPAGPP